MDWIKENKFLSGFIAVFVIGVAVLGYLLHTARSAYQTTMGAYEQSSRAVDGLRARPLFPGEDSLAFIDEESAKLDAAANALQTKLATFQRPLNTEMDDRTFQEKLTARVLAVKTLAVRRGAELPGDFALGMEEYTSAFPRSAAVPELDYQLDALEFLTTTLINSGVSEIATFSREKLAAESEPSVPAEDPADKKKAKNVQPMDAAPEPVAERYPVSLTFTISPGGLEDFLNTIANTPPGSFYLAPRLMAIENEADVGPERGVPFEARIIEDSIEEVIEEVEETAAADADADANADADADPDAADGAAPEPTSLISADESAVAREDSRIIIGTESLQVSTIIDLLRFDPVAAKAPSGEAASEDGADEEGA